MAIDSTSSRSDRGRGPCTAFFDPENETAGNIQEATINTSAQYSYRSEVFSWGVGIQVYVIEGRDYSWSNICSIVQVQIDSEIKYTSVQPANEHPFYNEYFVFEFTSTLENILDKNLTITVFRSGNMCKKRKALGYVALDVATIWAQSNHQFYHKWAILSAPRKEVMGGMRGYIKVDIAILTRGEVPKIPEVFSTNDIEGNLLLPEGETTTRQRATYTFNVYRGADFIKSHTGDERKYFEASPGSVHLNIVFADLRIETSTKKNTSKPVWNERLLLPELFPPLCQRFKLELYLDKKIPIAFRYMNLSSVSNDREEGYLPTFGPGFLNFYSHNPLEGYVGSVLLSLNTTLKSNDPAESIDPLSVQPAPALIEETVLKYETVTLVAVIYDVTCIDKIHEDKPVYFRLGCGKLKVKNLDESDAETYPVSLEMKPAFLNKNYCFWRLKETKPVLSLRLTLPDYRKKMYSYNMLSKIKKSLGLKLQGIEDMFKSVRHSSDELYNKLGECLDWLIASIQKFIDIVSGYTFVDGGDQFFLDQMKLKFSIKELKSIKQAAFVIYKLNGKKKKFQKIEALQRRIMALITHVEDWPNIYLWLVSDLGKRVAYSILEAKSVVFSPVDEEKGEHCGVMQTISFQSPNHRRHDTSLVCQMNVVFWMGINRHISSFLDNMPAGFTMSPEPIPKYVVAIENVIFRFDAHIFQGRFSPGMDKSGLCDPSVDVLIQDRSLSTKVVKKTLNPVWNQTLVARHLTLFGKKKFIRENPPPVIVEIYDTDGFKRELIGRTMITPIVKMLNDHYSPPKFKWFPIQDEFDTGPEILASFELLETGPSQNDQGDNANTNDVTSIPREAMPSVLAYTIEVYFWGVRDLKKVHCISIAKPKIIFQCGNATLTSSIIPNTSKNLNFSDPIQSSEVVLFEDSEYAPPVLFNMVDCRSFGVNVSAGFHVASMKPFVRKPLTLKERQRAVEEGKSRILMASESSVDTIIEMYTSKTEDADNEKSRCGNCWTKLCCCCTRKQKFVFNDDKGQGQGKGKGKDKHKYKDKESKIPYDWWTRFYASLENNSNDDYNKFTLKIFPSELENQPEFESFTDILTKFPMYKGKRTGDEDVDETNTMGVLKGTVRIYPSEMAKKEEAGQPEYVTPYGRPLGDGLLHDFPSNAPLSYVLRVYVVRGLNLTPRDWNGRSDPYLIFKIGDKTINDKADKLYRQLQPVFGKCFEINAVFPHDHTLTVFVYDYDRHKADDLIGMTKIDLENRYYSSHRGHCGLARTYFESGECTWRDQQKPSAILEDLCLKFNLPAPEYSATAVRVMNIEFTNPYFEVVENFAVNKELLALAALRRWGELPVVGCRLVPEHVETRSLYDPDRPGIEQGKLQMWIDMFPTMDLPVPPPVNIARVKPISYELRVIIWNTERVTLQEDDFYTGQRKSDIYVKAWLATTDFTQSTDVHYRSLSGEGNFNWRFIFLFDYIPTENKVVFWKKENTFDVEKSEIKVPCRLTLQVWDNDTISADDFLGVLTLELPRMPRGAYSSAKCDLSILDQTELMSLFRIKRTKGWWPFKGNKDHNGHAVFAGALEAELELLTKEEAEKNPAGLGRSEPQALPKPNRPDTSFSWFKDPLKALSFSLKYYKWKLTKYILIAMVIVCLVLAFKSFPEAIVKKIMNIHF